MRLLRGLGAAVIGWLLASVIGGLGLVIGLPYAAAVVIVLLGIGVGFYAGWQH